MIRRAMVTLLAAAALLTGTTGCGTRSILVPVTRPARIDIHRGSSALLIPTETADPQPFTDEIAVKLDSLLPIFLADDALRLHRGDWSPDVPPILAREGSVSRRTIRWWSARQPADVLLGCYLIRGRMTEQVASAEIQSSRNPGSEKRVRQGRAEATCRIILVDLSRESLLFDDTLAVSATHETHATDAAPPELDASVFSTDIARQIATTIEDAAHPVHDRDVVTFLVDDDIPGIDAAIVYAEEGHWDRAAGLLRSLADSADGKEDEDILWYDLGLALQYQRNFKDALAAFDRAIALRDRSRYKHARDALLRIEAEYIDDIRQQR